MALVRIDNVGELGIINDISPYDLPPEAWSAGQNVRFRNKKVERFSGHQSVFGAPSIIPYSLFSVRTLAQAYWIYAGLTKVYVTDMAAHFNITRQTATVDVDYSTNQDTKWNGGVLNGLPVLNNGVDEPQMWSPVNASQRLQQLTAWNTWPVSGVNTRARIIRPAFRNFLVAMSITESGSETAQTLAWSAPADPGTMPGSWDYTDPTKDTGKLSISDTGGFLLDLVMLGEIGVLYKDDSIYAMQFVGGQSVFRITQSPLKFGLLATNCAAMLPGYHFMATQDDIVVHDTRQAKSIINEKMRQFVFDNIDNTNKGRSFVVPNYRKSEMWFCYPESNQLQPTKAFVWNWDNNSTSIRELGAITPHIGIGVVALSTTPQDWDSQAVTWDSAVPLWDQRQYDPANTALLMARSDGTPKLYLADSGTQFDSANFTSYVERTGITIIGHDRAGNPKTDPDSIKLVKRILPRITGGPVNVYIGAQSLKDGPVTWSPPMSFNPALKNELQCYSVSRFPAVRFETTTNTPWKLEGYELDIALAGR